MRFAVRIGFVIGLGVLIVLIAHQGVQEILDLLLRGGWALLLLVPLHALPLLLDARGWQELVRARSRLGVLFFIACIREAVGRLLPTAGLGGEIVGIRLLVRQRVDGTVAAASVIVELTVTLTAQFIFAVLGVLCVLRLTDAVGLTSGLVLGLAASGLLLGVFFALLRNGAVFGRLERVAGHLFGLNSRGASELSRGAHLDAAIRDLLAAHGRLLRALFWQLAGLLVGCSETWLALRWLGHPVGVPAALALESSAQAARHVFFLVPAGLGVQEAGLMGVAHLLGIGADVAIALSLAKRMRELAFSLPQLIAWQWIEGRAALSR